MNSVERGAAIISAAVVIFGAGIAWNSLGNRIDKVDAKIGEIQKTLGSTPCTAILNRQLAAIDKGRGDVRKALDGLSDEYGCVQEHSYAIVPDGTNAAATMGASTANLSAQLNAVDVQLNGEGSAKK